MSGAAQLRLALQTLVNECAGSSGAVIDEGNGLWCSVPGSPEGALVADAFYKDEIAPQAHEMQRGHRLSVHRAGEFGGYVAESFASLYVVVVWLRGSFDAESVRARILRAVPAIEAIVTAMPPFDGPGPSGQALKARA